VPQSGQVIADQNNGVTATLTSTGNVPVPQKPVYFVISNPKLGAVLTTSGITNANGVAQAGVLNVPSADTGANGTGDTITAYFGGNVPLPPPPSGASYNAADPDYASSTNAAGVSVIAPVGMWSLGPGAGTLSLSGQATVSVTGSLAVGSSSNGGINLSGQATLKTTGALLSPAAKPVTSSGQATYSVASQQTLSEPDPNAGLAAPSTSGMTVYSSSSLQGPGVYTKAVTVSGQSSMTLASGTYVFDNGLTLSGQVTLKSATGGVLLYFAGGGLTISGQAAATLSPLASGVYAGIVLFQAYSDSVAVSLSGQGQTTSFAGELYTPAAMVGLSGQAKLSVAALIAQGTVLTGQAGLTA
ncbi:MAG TPA: hypothetical protein VK425_01075, partial [Acidimicrobiales bacterium]|nr:hypothetical protein [Acidimicrobiales bacterium]